MQRCPKCGYQERFDWALIARGLIFYGLCLTLILGNQREYRLIALGAMVLFTAVQLWVNSRNGKNLDSKLVTLLGEGDKLSLKPPANS